MAIKPEDVTKEHVAHIEDYLRSQSDWLLMPDNAQLATLANALIEAGIVSPPVYCERYRDGRLKKTPFGHVLVFTEGEEHWKGQVE